MFFMKVNVLSRETRIKGKKSTICALCLRSFDFLNNYLNLLNVTKLNNEKTVYKLKCFENYVLVNVSTTR